MNLLAHALLAGDGPALVVGVVVGDWIKGPLPGSLPADLACGVALHQQPFAEYRHGVSRQVAGRLAELPPHSHFAQEWQSVQLL